MTGFSVERKEGVEGLQRRCTLGCLIPSTVLILEMTEHMVVIGVRRANTRETTI